MGLLKPKGSKDGDWIESSPLALHFGILAIGQKLELIKSQKEPASQDDRLGFGRNKRGLRKGLPKGHQKAKILRASL